MATFKNFEEIDCWKYAKVLWSEIGKIIDSGKFEKYYRLIGQIEGSSGSIMDNIAEGFERGSTAEFIVFLGYAKGSCGEFRSQLYRARERNYLTIAEFNSLMNKAIEVGKMINGFIQYLQRTEIKGFRKLNKS